MDFSAYSYLSAVLLHHVKFSVNLTQIEKVMKEEGVKVLVVVKEVMVVEQ